MILVAVMTLLGAALFNLGVVDARWGIIGEVDYKALEVAQAGVERALHLLYLDICHGATDCTAPRPLCGWVTGATPCVSWADGDINGTAFPAASTFTSLTLGSHDFSTAKLGEVAGTGSYTIKLRNLTVSEANANFSVPCQKNNVNSFCDNLMLVRATGTYTVGGIPTTRTIQVLARTQATQSLSSGGIVAGAAGQSIHGNVIIAGSVHALGCSSPPCFDLCLGGTSGVQNHYGGMPGAIRNLIPIPQMVCQPGNTSCTAANISTTGVETLGGIVRAAAPVNSPALSLSGNAYIGDKGYASPSSPPNSNCGESGSAGCKPTIDALYIANGCQTADCSDNFVGASHIFSDNGLTNAYDVNPVPDFPALKGYSVTVGDTTYQNYACAGVAGCTDGSTQDFFGSHAYWASTAALGSGLQQLFTYWDSGGSAPADFNERITFVDPQSPPGTSPNKNACIQWVTTGNKLRFVRYTGGSCTTTPLSVVAGDTPPLIYLNRGGGNFNVGSSITYEGAAVIVARGTVALNGNVSPPACSPCPAHDTFPKNNWLSILTPGTMSLGSSPHLQIFAFLYSGAAMSIDKQTHVVGSAMARTFDMGTNVPNFWQVENPWLSFPPQPAPAQAYRVKPVPPWWRECVPATPADTAIKCWTGA